MKCLDFLKGGLIWYNRILVAESEQLVEGMTANLVLVNSVSVYSSLLGSNDGVIKEVFQPNKQKM